MALGCPQATWARALSSGRQYQGRPVDVVSVYNQSSGRGTIQLSLGGKTYFVWTTCLTWWSYVNNGRAPRAQIAAGNRPV